MSVEPWTTKYRPRTSKDVAGNKPAIEKLRDWVESWSKGRPSKAAVLLYGPAGVGKTSVTEALARERGWDLVEINASDKRSGDILAKVAGLASTQSTLFSKGRLILLDEVDGINLRADQGAVATILQIIKETQYPLILTANDPWDPKTRPLRQACLPKELEEAMLALAESDLYFGRIKKTQSWHLLSYALDLMTAGVAVAKQTSPSGWVPMRFPQKISSMSRTRSIRDTRKKAAASIGHKSHVSVRRAQQLYLPLLRFIYEHNPDEYERIAVWLDAREELDVLVEPDANMPIASSPHERSLFHRRIDRG